MIFRMARLARVILRITNTKDQRVNFVSQFCNDQFTNFIDYLLFSICIDNLNNSLRYGFSLVKKDSPTSSGRQRLMLSRQNQP